MKKKTIVCPGCKGYGFVWRKWIFCQLCTGTGKIKAMFMEGDKFELPPEEPDAWIQMKKKGQIEIEIVGRYKSTPWTEPPGEEEMDEMGN